MFKAKVYISLKKTVADPQGMTVKNGLASLGFKNVGEARVGKYLELELNTKNKAEADSQVKEMCEKLLANPVIEDYNFEIL